MADGKRRGGALTGMPARGLSATDKDTILKKMKMLPIIDVDGVLVSSDILTERFCCDLDVCRGACCVEGDAGAPVTLDEMAAIEDVLDEVWHDLSASAQAVIDRQGVAYTDVEGALVTSIVGGKDCVFTCHEDGCCLCALERAWRAKKAGAAPERADGSDAEPDNSNGAGGDGTDSCYGDGRDEVADFCKPISCALYPIREVALTGGVVGLNYHRWDICRAAVAKGRELDLPVYRFLEGPLTRRFGKEWYDELVLTAEELKRQGYI